MADMRLGYGSEYQLLRLLGHHREAFFKLIRDKIGTNSKIEWLDYPVDENRQSFDGELKGIECFRDLPNFDNIQKEWDKFWATGSGTLNWDGIFKCGDEWFFVEAKAREKEFNSKCGATSQSSKDKISNALEKTATDLEADKSGDKYNWIETNCYQLANRLAFIYFCKEHDIKAKLLYVDFLNGYIEKYKNVLIENKSIADKAGWDKIWDEAYKTLGLSNEKSQKKLKDILYRVHPDCLNPRPSVF